MPNWVVNKITVDGPGAKEAIRSHLTRAESGEEEFDFNTIERMPKRLNIEKSSRSLDGFKLYIAKINPLIDNFGSPEDKARPFSSFIRKLEKAFHHMNYDRIGKFVLKPEEVAELKEKYGEKLDDTLKLGEKVFHNMEDYGVPDWYEWSVDHWGTKWNSCNTMVSDDDKTVYFDTAWSPSIPAIEKFAKMHPKLKITHEYAEEQMGFCSGRVEYEDGKVTEEAEFEPYSKEAYEMSFELWGGEGEYRWDEKEGTYEYVGDEPERGQAEME